MAAPRDEASTFAEKVAGAASPIDDVRGTERYRRDFAIVPVVVGGCRRQFRAHR